MPGEVTLRRVVPGDWPALKALRLEALQDAPVAFLETYADTVVLDDDAWRYRATRGSEGGDSCQLVAWDGPEPLASAITYRDGDGRWWLVGVYVRPASRGQGLLERLVDGLVAHARTGGGDRLLLEVHEGNARARAAYRRLGFTETGGRRPHPQAAGDELEMARPLPGPQIG